MEQDNRQLVVSCTNRATLEQAWFNEARTRKPQTFKADAAGVVDPTDGGRRCDFCNWQQLTAEDTWGRVERPHAVTGSNLFKYGEPAHGLVLFKHHDPLAFNRDQLYDFMAVSDGWFAAAAAAHGGGGGGALHPFFIWNCGPRAGASQFHGHGQLMLTSVPVPAQARLDQQAALHAAAHSTPHNQPVGSAAAATAATAAAATANGGVCYYRDLIRAHAAVGLARKVVVPRPQQPRATANGDGAAATANGCGSSYTENGSSSTSNGAAAAAAATADHEHDVAWVLAHLAPQKDMEVIVIAGGSSSSPGSSSGGLSSPAFVAALHASLRALIDGLGVQTFNCGVMNVPLQPPLQPEQTLQPPAAAAAAVGGLQGAAGGGGDDEDGWLGLPPLPRSLASGGGDGAVGAAGGSCWRPMMARLVSRGKWAAPASDFGCLEVVGHASIGHTDPFVLIRAVDSQLAAAGVAAAGGPAGA
ncbi:hypothetical protein HXX76_015938 [Chlamydomonas incerta]|uniref:Galactose-1-phosphate uridyl transferase N-terminal domain-containing protein n=1 Tax=Chlamydomonas incerta TaxID=51695 RepID=A0A835S875_CHLIN|nr:hypothetical protein HXX76_015938 [Chlamydomonas incerta]|eukprot:KAG2422558.1 hypothetical protein HXX76_015938 [Chlamydomonas incerta]